MSFPSGSPRVAGDLVGAMRSALASGDRTSFLHYLSWCSSAEGWDEELRQEVVAYLGAELDKAPYGDSELGTLSLTLAWVGEEYGSHLFPRILRLVEMPESSDRFRRDMMPVLSSFPGRASEMFPLLIRLWQEKEFYGGGRTISAASEDAPERGGARGRALLALSVLMTHQEVLPEVARAEILSLMLGKGVDEPESLLMGELQQFARFAPLYRERRGVRLVMRGLKMGMLSEKEVARSLPTSEVQQLLGEKLTQKVVERGANATTRGRALLFLLQVLLERSDVSLPSDVLLSLCSSSEVEVREASIRLMGRNRAPSENKQGVRERS